MSTKYNKKITFFKVDFYLQKWLSLFIMNILVQGDTKVPVFLCLTVQLANTPSLCNKL
jgi:hypothetical protein